MDAPLVEARALTKRFGDFTAVDGIDFAIQPGEAFGFLGPNGAGKTSTMRMIGCVSRPSSGELRVLGRDPRREGKNIRARLGVVPQEDNLDTELTVWDNLMIYGRYFDLPRATIRERAQELLEFVQLADRHDSKVDPLSGGMKRRLTIARALINEPHLMLLDEPTTGLDPQARHMLWERLYRLKQQGVTLVLTTHYMDEAEQLCDRLVIMDNARIVAEGAPRELIERYATREVTEVRFPLDVDIDAAVPKLQAMADRVEPLADRVLVYTEDGDAVAAMLAGEGIPIVTLLVRRASLEDVFLILTGRTLEDQGDRVATPAVVRVVEREARVFRALWRGLMFSMFLNPALFLAAMGLGLGGMIDAHSGTVNGVDYLDFVAPGLMVASAMQLAAGESMWPVLAGVKWMRYYFGVISTPIGTGDLYGGFLIWTALRTMLCAASFLVVAALLGAVSSVWGVLAIPATALTCCAFAAPIAAYSINQESDLTFPVILRIGILPLFLFSGTFFPVSELPNWLEPLAALSPLWHGVELARMATTGVFRAGPALVHVLYLSLWVAVGSWFACKTFARRLVP